MINKRILAYLIDMAILLVILGLINILYAPDITNLKNEMNEITLDYINKDINFNTYMNKTSQLYQKQDLSNIYLNIINVLYIILYFIVAPYFNNGMTIGKQMMKIKVVGNKNLTIVNLILRNLIITGLLYLLIIIICCLYVPSDYYYSVITVLSLIQIILMIICALTLNKKALHDIIANTRVEESS